METLAYAVWLEPAKEGGYVVTCRDLPEVVTQRDDLEEPLAQASDAMDEALAARIDDGEDFPETSALRKGEYLVAPGSDLSAKAALDFAMKEAAISKSALARILQVDEKGGSAIPRPASSIQIAADGGGAAHSRQAPCAQPSTDG